MQQLDGIGIRIHQHFLYDPAEAEQRVRAEDVQAAVEVVVGHPVVIKYVARHEMQEIFRQRFPFPQPREGEQTVDPAVGSRVVLADVILSAVFKRADGGGMKRGIAVCLKSRPCAVQMADVAVLVVLPVPGICPFFERAAFVRQIERKPCLQPRFLLQPSPPIPRL